MNYRQKKIKICKEYDNTSAVSSIVGEMLMLSLVLILIPMVSISVSSFVPSDREPILNIINSGTDDTFYNVTLWHKGGDVLEKRKIKVTFSSGTDRFALENDCIFINNDADTANFMPGDFIRLNAKKDIRGYEIQLVTSESVIYTGKVGDCYK